MAYFKWRAYDKYGEYSNGVSEEEHWQIVVMRLMQHKLFPSVVEKIEYNEYIFRKKADDHLNIVNNVKSRLNRFFNPSVKIRSLRCILLKWAIIGFSIVAGLCFLVLLVYHYCQ
jgi:hypothetical protein